MFFNFDLAKMKEVTSAVLKYYILLRNYVSLYQCSLPWTRVDYNDKVIVEIVAILFIAI